MTVNNLWKDVEEYAGSLIVYRLFLLISLSTGRILREFVERFMVMTHT